MNTFMIVDRKTAGGIYTMAVLVLLTLAACSGQPVFHSFNFDIYNESPDIELLNYRYGDSKMTFTRPFDDRLATGVIEQGGGIAGSFPVGASLYVKWRVKATGKIYEDTVDLKSRLPYRMNLKILHFMIHGSQLYVYLIEGDGSGQIHAKNAPDCPVRKYHLFGCTEVYPEHWSNI